MNIVVTGKRFDLRDCGGGFTQAGLIGVVRESLSRHNGIKGLQRVARTESSGGFTFKRWDADLPLGT